MGFLYKFKEQHNIILNKDFLRDKFCHFFEKNWDFLSSANSTNFSNCVEKIYQNFDIKKLKKKKSISKPLIPIPKPLIKKHFG